MSQKILVIDDSLAASKLTENVLAQNFHGVDVLLAQRGGDAFDRFNVAQPDLILLNETLPDMDAEAICYRLLNDPATAKVPVVLHGDERQRRRASRSATTTSSRCCRSRSRRSRCSKSSAPRSRRRSPTGNPARQLLFHDPSRTVFSGHTAFFSLRSALQMAYGDRLTGVLRFFVNRFPIELFISKGRFLFATTRNFQLYCRESPVILSATNLGLIIEGQISAGGDRLPDLPLPLGAQRLPARRRGADRPRSRPARLLEPLDGGPRDLRVRGTHASFPDYAKNFPPGNEDPDNWILGSLRHVKYENLMGGQRPDPNGSPAYTRKGYELIQKLKLNDVEARFATAINGAESLQSIAKKIGIPLNDALLIVFRFAALDIIDYWSSNVLSLPGRRGFGFVEPRSGAQNFRSQAAVPYFSSRQRERGLLASRRQATARCHLPPKAAAQASRHQRPRRSPY